MSEYIFHRLDPHRRAIVPHPQTIGFWLVEPSGKENQSVESGLFGFFVLPSFTEQSTNFVIIPPAELLRRFYSIFWKIKKV